jgi:hypothetical protein
MKKKTVGHVKSQFSKRNRWKIEHFSQRRFLKKLNRKRNSMKDPVKSTHLKTSAEENSTASQNAYKMRTSLKLQRLCHIQSEGMNFETEISKIKFQTVKVHSWYKSARAHNMSKWKTVQMKSFIVMKKIQF